MKSKLSIHLEAGNIAKEIKTKIKEYVKTFKAIHFNEIDKLINNFYKKYECVELFPTNYCEPSVIVHGSRLSQKNKPITKGIIKIDFGFVYKKAPIDTCMSIVLNDVDKENLYEKYNLVFELVEKEIKVGVPISRISNIIQTYIESLGLQVVPFLVGHTIQLPSLWAEPTIYNVSNKESATFYEGQIFTIEPVALLVNKDAEVSYLRDKSCIWEYHYQYILSKKQPYTNAQEVDLIRGIYRNEYVNSFLTEHTYYLKDNTLHRLT